ncbi:hypothetical protein HMPREF9071_0629 [Capnocytophaga sp. oral taxon 338 str. F0234]|nr:hypothetical protein HMPREF9071_0629 [Capnocytophaga sp. oral taxon 338 str. F0234]
MQIYKIFLTFLLFCLQNEPLIKIVIKKDFYLQKKRIFVPINR